MTTKQRMPPGELSPGEDFAAFCAVLYDPPPEPGRIQAAAAIVRRLVTRPLHPGEFEALTVLFMDAGEGRRAGTLTPEDLGRDGADMSASGKQTELMRLVQNGIYVLVPAQLMLWQSPKDPQALLIRRRRLASVMLWDGLPWRWVAEAARTNPGLTVELARAVAQREREALTAPKPPEPAAPVQTFTRQPARPLPGDEDPAPPRATARLGLPPNATLIVEPPARISPNTKRLEEVEYQLDPALGLKPIDESERVDGLVWQRVARWGVKFSAAGGFGVTGVNVANALDAGDVNLIATGLDMAGDAAWFAGTYAASWVAKQYGTWKRKRGETRARQGLY